MAFRFAVPTPSGNKEFNLDAGKSIVFVGANGSGKSRLAVYIEQYLQLNAHRISAHRSLGLNPDVPKIQESKALSALRTGAALDDVHLGHRNSNRWRENAATILLNDFDYLIQVLFANQANVALETHKKRRSGNLEAVEPTKFERLVEIWERLLPHRQLHITGDNIQVSPREGGDRYKASEMSDGERAIFYLIGQTLAASPNSLLIFDEPELHVHRAIASKLWDELEAARQDCGFVFITHDLDYAASKVAEKFVISNFRPAVDAAPNPIWSIEEVPLDAGFSEEVAALILGSRRPILFVEGQESSLDKAIYRVCYPDWTVIPKGSCEEVIHSVVTMRRNAALTRVTCSGIVDADDYSAQEREGLGRLGVAILPVSEIENLFLLPNVSRAILEHQGFKNGDLDRKFGEFEAAILRKFGTTAEVEKVIVRYCKRRIDRALKSIDLSEEPSVDAIIESYRRKTGELPIEDIAGAIRGRLAASVASKDMAGFLANFDHKGLLAEAARLLKDTNLLSFESWLVRVLKNNAAPNLVTALKANLPPLTAK